MIIISEDLLKKHSVGIEAAMNYYVYNRPTGILDSYYDQLEREARKDGIELRDYVTQFIQGDRTLNASYIHKVEKKQVKGNMYEAVKSYQKEVQTISYWIPKYDGSSVAAYYDVNTGKCIRVVTIGGTNLGSEGIDQTEKFSKYFPDLPGTGIMALQCECLVPLEKGLGDKSRQKANGLVICSFKPLSREEFSGTDTGYKKYLDKFYENSLMYKDEIDELITFRCFRYYKDSNYPITDYKETLESLPVIYNKNGEIKFCGGYVSELKDLGDFINTDIWKTPTGTFLVDGIVGYSKSGECIKALKYADAGRGELSEVLGIKWNDQSSKGKDSWSANALINPILIRGVEIRKPSIGSLKRMLEKGLSKGSKVTVILANSTIPQVSEVLTPGNLDYEWPTCKCGYKMGPNDIYGMLLKCGNPECSERYNRMKSYLSGCNNIREVNLNILLVIDRFDWYKKTDVESVYKGLEDMFTKGVSKEDFTNFLSGYMSTENQKRNLVLVSGPAYRALYEFFKNLSTL